MISICSMRIMIALLAVLAATGCAVVHPRPVQIYSSGIVDVLAGKAILGHEVTEAELPNYDIFQVTPEMEAFARQAIRHSDNYFEKVKALQVALLTAQEAGGHGIVYNAYVTEVPMVTFEQRRANCLSFTLLYVALARAVGIYAQVNEVQVPPTWDLRNKKDMVFLRHVNVKVPIPRENINILNTDDVVIDLEMNRYRANYSQHEINDTSAAAQFYSNRAMEHLENNNMIDAFLSLRKSINLNDQQSYVWSNLGVLYSRKQLWREAELTYLHGLELNSEDLTIMNNLSFLYNKIGNKVLSKKYSKLAQRYRESNPFYQYSLALSAYEQGDYSAASQFITRSIDLEKNDTRFYELAASIYDKQGRLFKASEMLKKAKKLKSTELYKGQ